MSTTSNGPDVEETLAQFRRWLQQVRDEADALGEEAEAAAAPPAPEPVGLLRVVEEFTALRHELKLSTKSARALEEQSGAAVEGLKQAIAAFEAVKPKEAEAAQRAVWPLLQAFAGLDEALRRGRAVVENMRRRVVQESTDALLRELEIAYRRLPWGIRWVAVRWHQTVRGLVERQAQAHAEIFDSLVAGYDLIQNRLHRAMAAEGMARSECLGRPVDPHTMTVVEAVDAAGAAPGTVIDEVRPGYVWKGKVVQYAEVRAVRTRQGL